MLGIELSELLSFDVKNVFNFAENCNPISLAQGNILLTETKCVHELEKAHLLIEQQNKEIAYLKELNELLKSKMGND